MVNFRFHLVSLIAVFLALGLGILTGSAVVNQATVQTIRREIRDVRAEVNSLRSTNGQLKDDLNRTNASLADSAAYAVDGRLIDVPVAVLAERGVSGDDVNDTITLVRAAGAVAPAVVWLESKWKLGSDGDVQALRDATNLLGSANTVRQRALDALALRLTSPPVAPVPGEPPVPDLLKRLSDAGFISIDPGNADMATFPPTPARALLVTGTKSDFAGTDVTADTAQALVTATRRPSWARSTWRKTAATHRSAATRWPRCGPRTVLRPSYRRSTTSSWCRGRSRPCSRSNSWGSARSGTTATAKARRRACLRRSRTREGAFVKVKRRRAAPGQSWTSAATRMGAVTAVSRGFGFVRVLVVAAVLGTTFLGNAFQAANSVSNVLFELVAAGALSAVLVPSFVTLLERGEDEEADRLASGLLGLALVGLGLLTLVGVIFAPLIARLLTVGVSNDVIAAQQRALETYLLRWFLPQIVLYAWGAIATALLYARRRFSITAAAPIGNTVVMVAALVVFRVVAGPDPTLRLTDTERLLLAIAGTGGVVAFVGILCFAARQSGFSLRPRWLGRHAGLGRLLRLSGWGALLNANTGLLLGAAIIVGGSVAGGVVAYQVAFVFFLAPYAILAQPILTAILPELALEVAGGDMRAFTASVRAALDRMGVLVVPVSAALGRARAADDARRGVRPRRGNRRRAARRQPRFARARPVPVRRVPAPRACVLRARRQPHARVRGDRVRVRRRLDDDRTGVGDARRGAGRRARDRPYRRLHDRCGHPRGRVSCAAPVGASRRATSVWSSRIRVFLAALAWLAMRALDPDTRATTFIALAVVGSAGLVAYAAAARRWLQPADPIGAAA